MTDTINPPLPVGLLTDGEASIIRAWAEALADAAVAQERERCAATVETFPYWLGPKGRKEIAAAIRAGEPS